MARTGLRSQVAGGEPPASNLDSRSAVPPFTAIRVFEAIGRYGGIRKAAAVLSIDHSAVSRHLRALEQWAGVPLVNRTPGAGGYLTTEGQLYHSRISRALSEIASASIDLTRRGESPQFRLRCVPGIASVWLTGRLGGFAEAHPDIELEVQPTHDVPDFSTHEVDAWLHYLSDSQAPGEVDPNLRTEEVGRPPIIAVASPRFIQNMPPIEDLSALLSLPLLHESDFDQWRRWFRKQGLESCAELSGPRLWHAHLTLAAARQGQGIALANVLLLGNSLSSGELVQVGDWPAVDLGGYRLTARRDRWRDRTVMGFRRWLRSMIDAEPWAQRA